MKINNPTAILMFAFIFCAGSMSSLAIAQDKNKSFYNKELNEDISIWRLRQKQLTGEEQKELDRHVENLNEARLKEQRAQEDLDIAKKSLTEFLNEKGEKLEKEKAILQEQINRSEQKVARIQENLDKKKQELESLQKGLDGNIAKTQEALTLQQQKIEELITKEQEKLEKTRVNTKSISAKIAEFEKAIDEKFKR
ncbi:MAG: hypothetical protein NT079_00695 [Candidatus Omnitrophica bacterium]|nr:hypothetical protein [Candidatus Omnitrophota bacterium]